MLGNLTDNGVGGKHCPCCAPAPKHRTFYRRNIKRSERQQWKKEINQWS